MEPTEPLVKQPPATGLSPREPADFGKKDATGIGPTGMEPFQTVGRNNPRTGKPFPFALAHGIAGASIWHGCLLSSRTLVYVTKDTEKLKTISQAPVPKLEYIPADNLDTDLRLQTHLGFYGNVYAKWEANDSGAIMSFEIVGPDEPAGIDIGELDTDLNRSPVAGTYYILIGTVLEDAPVDQKISSDIPWFVTIIKGAQGGSSSSSGGGGGSQVSISFSSAGSGASGGSGAGSGSGSGSSKSTCIVPSSKHKEGFAALFLPEMPREAVFLDTLSVFLHHRYTLVEIDPHFVEVCEPGTFKCVGSSVEGQCYAVSVEISRGGMCEIRRPWFSRAAKVNLFLYAIRKGFLHPSSASPYHQRRMPARNEKQFHQCESFIQSAYDAHE
jgi:hypothetical protein